VDDKVDIETSLNEEPAFTPLRRREYYQMTGSCKAMLDKMQAQMNARYAVTAGGYLSILATTTPLIKPRQKKGNHARKTMRHVQKKSTTIFVVTGGSDLQP